MKRKSNYKPFKENNHPHQAESLSLMVEKIPPKKIRLE